jgi:2-(1,2-epoxy-1,2-dihydrophenyl)acetyl-CoA isomerase
MRKEIEVGYEHISLAVDGGVASIVLDRPDAANAFDLEFGRELMSVAIRCDEDPAVRAVVITGRGRFFSAGGDLEAFADAQNIGALIKELTTYAHAALSRFRRMDAPVITAVNGAAAGVGFGLAVAGDLVLAAESAVFTLGYSAAGLVPDGGSTFVLPRLVGARRAMEMMLTNRRLTAEEALEWGLVTRVVPDDLLVEEAMELARTLAEGPTCAFGAIKRLLLDGAAGTLETQMELEARAIAKAAASRDGQEGIAAFLEKRHPTFRGE